MQGAKVLMLQRQCIYMYGSMLLQHFDPVWKRWSKGHWFLHNGVYVYVSRAYLVTLLAVRMCTRARERQICTLSPLMKETMLWGNDKNKPSNAKSHGNVSPILTSDSLNTFLWFTFVLLYMYWFTHIYSLSLWWFSLECCIPQTLTLTMWTKCLTALFCCMDETKCPSLRKMLPESIM